MATGDNVLLEFELPFGRCHSYTFCKKMKMLAIIIAILFSGLGAVQASPETKTTETLKTATRLAVLVIEYVAFTQTFPSKEEGLALLANRPSKAPFPRRWKMLLEELPKDSWGNDFVYSISDINDDKDQARLSILSMGADGKLDGGDDVLVSWHAKLP